ncbi:4'-phosphopantetheinyl transferase superfamily protein [Porticoccaceae bacterium]|nr:4'-phosphopantetheinyl transferase superfamily protein [Porticoccaceae bacterium]
MVLNWLPTYYLPLETMVLRDISAATPFDPQTASSISFCHCSFDWQKASSRSFQQYAVQRPIEACNWSSKRLSEFLAGRFCAIKALARLDPSGAPSVSSQLPIQEDHSPQWPKGTVGSISHSHNRAIAIAGRTTEFVGLGIDYEPVMSDLAAAEIAPWVLHPEDLQCEINIPISYGFLVTLLFSAKESLFKALSSKALSSGAKNSPDFGDFMPSVSVSRVTANALFFKNTVRT